MGAVRTAIGTVLAALAKHLPANGLRIACHRWRGVGIGRGVFLGYDVNLDLVAPELIHVGDHARIGTGTMLFAHYVDAGGDGTPTETRQAPVWIGRSATLYAGALVMPGVRVGDFAIVRAGAVVEDDVPAFAVAAGVPARIVSYRTVESNHRAPARERAAVESSTSSD